MEQKSNNKNKAIGGRPPLDKMENVQRYCHSNVPY